MKAGRIDSHQHFWRYNPARHVWMSEQMGSLKTDFLPADLRPHLNACHLNGCVAVQADQSEDENAFLLGLASEYAFIRGIVGWVDLQSENVEERLAYYQQFPLVKGFRHVLHDEPEREYMLRPAFRRGISKLAAFGYTYDLLIFVEHLASSLELVRAFPDQPFVIDHLAKPGLNPAVVDAWKNGLTKLAACENVSCKISGLITETGWQQPDAARWDPADFTPYLDAVLDLFGTDRVMYGSDWPVCTLAGSYEAVYGLAAAYFSRFSEAEQRDFFGENARRFYGLGG